MSDEKALLGAIWDYPHEDTPRLAYAEFLQETGTRANVARAEFIRLQIEFAALDEDDPQYREARAEANRLLKRWGKPWRLTMPGVNRLWAWQRGFPYPDDRGIEIDDLFKLSLDDLRAVPCRNFSVMDTDKRLDDLLAWPHLDRLDNFYLRDGIPAGNWVPRVLACRGFRNVCSIFLIDCPVTVPQLESLLTGWRDRRIVTLQLNGSKIGDDGLRMVLDHPVMADVRKLGIRGIGLTSAGVRMLAESGYHPPAPELELAWNRFGNAGVAELVRWPGLSRIRTLGLNHTLVGDAGAAALAGCEALRGLRGLWLGDNRIGPEGAAAIAASPNLKRLTRLYLHNNPLPADAVRNLRRCFGENLKVAGE